MTNKESGVLNIPVRYIKTATYFLLAIPIMIFFAGWLKLWISMPLCTGILVAIWFAMSSNKKQDMHSISGERMYSIKYSLLLIVLLVVLGWVFFSGIGGMFSQSSDHDARNAILRDMINYNWPVYYPTYDNALVYYITFWMIPAFAGKLAMIATGGNLDIAWQVANFVLYIYTVLCLFVTSLLLLSKVKAFSKKRMVATMLIFVFFSGMDIVGLVLTKFTSFSITMGSHLEWWNMRWQFSSNSTQLFWVFNQSTATWMAVLLFLHEKNVKNFAFIAALMVPYSPLPIYGFAVLLAVAGVQRLVESIKEKRVLSFFGACFSIQNILAVICIVPLFFLYFSNNQIMESESSGWNFSYTWIKDPTLFVTYLIFLFVEIGVFMLLIFSDHKKNPLWYALLISFIIIPFIRVGASVDFCMRASLPALFVLMVYVIEYIFEHTKKFSYEGIQMNVTALALLVCIGLGCVTSITEFRRGIADVTIKNTIFLPYDRTKTLNRGTKVGNFVCNDPVDSSLFFKWFAKELK